MTTAICFDLDGTLLQYEQSHDAVTAAALETHLGAAPGPLVESYTEAFLAAFESLDPEPYHAGVRAALERARGDEFDGVDASGTDADAVVATRREREVSATTLPSAARDCLETLAGDDARVAVVTDGVDAWQRAKLDRHGLAEFLDETVVSYEVGGHKIDGDPYDAVRERLPADEYVMVGDSYESDVEAARAAGFVPVHYEEEGADLFEILRAFL